MKKLTFILFVIIASTACSTNKSINSSFLYQVEKIDSIHNFYIIYARQKEQRFKIVSENKFSHSCKKIKKGKYYPFKLTSIIDQPIKLGDKTINTSGNLLVNCFMFDSITEICREPEIPDLHRAENLTGLCLKD